MYRKRFVLELLMAVQGSPVADGEAKTLALGTLCRAARVPAAARDLAAHAGAPSLLSLLHGTAVNREGAQRGMAWHGLALSSQSGLTRV